MTKSRVSRWWRNSTATFAASQSANLPTGNAIAQSTGSIQHKKRKYANWSAYGSVQAGDEGIGPPTAVLETAVIPLHQSPSGASILFFRLFVLCMRATPLAKLLEFYLPLNELLVLARPIVRATALLARQLYQLILRHCAPL